MIAAGATVTGTLRGEGIIQVEGTVEGEIDLKGAVIIAPTGLVKGPVTADVIRMAGRIEGVVCARERLLLQKTGSLEGDSRPAERCPYFNTVFPPWQGLDRTHFRPPAKTTCGNGENRL